MAGYWMSKPKENLALKQAGKEEFFGTVKLKTLSVSGTVVVGSGVDVVVLVVVVGSGVVVV